MHIIRLEDKGFISWHCHPILTNSLKEQIIQEFAGKGLKVSLKAIEHNYDAWSQDLKSGFKDEGNGTFLFTPCGCNPLSFTAEALKGESYEITYEC